MNKKEWDNYISYTSEYYYNNKANQSIEEKGAFMHGVQFTLENIHEHPDIAELIAGAKELRKCLAGLETMDIDISNIKHYVDDYDIALCKFEKRNEVQDE